MEQNNLKKYRRLIWLLGFFKIRLLFFVRPQLVKLNEEELEVIVKFRKRNKNHLNSMYFGALAVGADLAGGIHALYFCDKKGLKPHFSFKSMDAQFLKRVESDAHFICKAGKEIEQVVEKAYATKERQNFPVPIAVLDDSGEEVAKFTMEMSIKLK